MAGAVASGGDVQNVRKRETVKTDAENSFLTLWGKRHTATSLGIVPLCLSLGLLPVTKATVHQGQAQCSLDACWLCWNVQGTEFTCVSWAEAQLELGKWTEAGLKGLLHLASPPGQEPAHLQVPFCLSLTNGPSCAKRSELFA